MLKIYYLAFFLFMVTFCLHFLGRKRPETATVILALIANLGVLASLIISSGHLPFFNAFEESMTAAFILGFLGLTLSKPAENIPSVRTWVWSGMLLLLIVSLFSTKSPSLYQYDHDHIYTNLFHGLRVVTLSVMLFSSAHYLQFRVGLRQGRHNGALLHQGRNFLILSAVLFLSAEYVGILWCQSGWGDFWRWNQGFFQSTLIALYIMLAFHLPGRGRSLDGLKSLIGGMAGFVVLALYVIRSLA